MTIIDQYEQPHSFCLVQNIIFGTVKTIIHR
jgi:hypothetical protein